MRWLTRSGVEHTGRVENANEAKGTAECSYVARCSRCGGAGRSDRWACTGYTCYECGGSGRGSLRTEKLYTAAKLAKLNASAEKREAKRAAKAEAASIEAGAAWTTWETEHAELISALREVAGQNPFLDEILGRVNNRWVLTGNQIAAAETAIARVRAQRAAKAAHQYVGTVGERINLTITVDRVIDLNPESQFGPTYIFLCHDPEGNKIVYKGAGSSMPNTGETATVKATVKEHSEYRDEKQTVIARPKVLQSLQEVQ